MTAGSFEVTVRSKLREVADSPDFDGEQFWLSFDLHGSPADLKKLSDDLEANGWSQIDRQNSWQGGFLYPRQLVNKSFEAIREALEGLEQLCRRHGAEIDLMDALNGPIGSDTHSVLLWHSPFER